MTTNESLAGILNLILNNIAFANIGDAGGLQPSATAGNLYVSLHTGALAAGSNQSTNEAAYTGYARAAVLRSPGSPQWTVSAPTAVNASQIAFPQCTAGTETETFFGIGTAASGAGHLIWGGPIAAHFYGFTAETTGNISVPGSSFSVNDPIAFFAEWSDVPFPTGITAGTLYYVKTVSGDVYTVSATVGGSPITISAAGAGNCSVITPFVINNGDTPALAASQCVILGV